MAVGRQPCAWRWASKPSSRRRCRPCPQPRRHAALLAPAVAASTSSWSLTLILSRAEAVSPAARSAPARSRIDLIHRLVSVKAARRAHRQRVERSLAFAHRRRQLERQLAVRRPRRRRFPVFWALCICAGGNGEQQWESTCLCMCVQQGGWLSDRSLHVVPTRNAARGFNCSISQQPFNSAPPLPLHQNLSPSRSFC